MRPVVAQPQSTEGRQRKRSRIGRERPSMPSQGLFHRLLLKLYTPPVPETEQRRPNPNRQQKEKKRNLKSIREFVQDMHQQNCVLMEKKFYIQRAYQDEKLQILRERSEKLFALESRRLDLEFMRMEQQKEWHREQMERLREQMQWRREDSRIRELALQFESYSP